LFNLKTTTLWAARLCLAILIIALFVGGSQPLAGSLFPPPWDKVVHIIFYGGMLVIAKLAYPNTALWKLAAGILLIGVLDEVHQMFVPGRKPGWDDLTADIVGIALATIVIKWVCYLKQSIPESQD
jgi:VanZ family protein